MGVTFSYMGWTDMTNVEVTGIDSRQEPGPPDAARHMTVSVIEGTGIVTMTADANTTTGVRRRIDDIRKILTTPGGRLIIAFDGVTVVDHVSADYATGAAGYTVDCSYGPVMEADISEILGGRVVKVTWRATYRLWANVDNLNPITGFTCIIRFSYDQYGMATMHRSGVLTVRRSAPFPARDNESSAGTTAWIPGGAMPFGGGQSPQSVGITTTTIGNNPDLYRRFVAGTLLAFHRRVSQEYYVDESMQRLIFSVVDKQTAVQYPGYLLDSSVNFSVECDLDTPTGLKHFSAELWAKPDGNKSQLLALAVNMSKSRIIWSSGTGEGADGSDIIQSLTIREMDLTERCGLAFEVTARGTTFGFGFGGSLGNIFDPIMSQVPVGGGGAGYGPDAYGTLGVVRLTDFVYDAVGAGTHVSPNTQGMSILGTTQVVPVQASIVTTAVANLLGETAANPIPPGGSAGAVAEADPGYTRMNGSMTIRVETGIVLAPSATATGPDRAYQFGHPVAIVDEALTVVRLNQQPVTQFNALPWPHVVKELSSTVSPPRIDANGNLWFIGDYRRSSRVLTDTSNTAATSAPMPGGGNARWFWPGSLPTPFNPQLENPTVDPPTLPASGANTP